MITSSCRADDGTRRNPKSPKGWQTSRGGSLLACTPQELINVKRASDRGFRQLASGTKSDFSIIEPGYRSLIVCQSPGRSWVPVSRGSLDSLSAPVLNPLPGFSDQAKMQVKVEQCHRRLIGREDAGNRAVIHRVGTQKDLDGFPPRTYRSPEPPLACFHLPGEAGQNGPAYRPVRRNSPLSKWNGHDLLL
jgi:hypothetical protein